MIISLTLAKKQEARSVIASSSLRICISETKGNLYDLLECFDIVSMAIQTLNPYSLLTPLCYHSM